MNITFGFENCETIVCARVEAIKRNPRAKASERKREEKRERKKPCTEQVVIYVFRFVTFNRTNSKQHYYYKSEKGRKKKQQHTHETPKHSCCYCWCCCSSERASEQAKRTSRSLLNEINIGDDRMYGKSF